MTRGDNNQNQPPVCCLPDSVPTQHLRVSVLYVDTRARKVLKILHAEGSRWLSFRHVCVWVLVCVCVFVLRGFFAGASGCPRLCVAVCVSRLVCAFRDDSSGSLGRRNNTVQ